MTPGTWRKAFAEIDAHIRAAEISPARLKLEKLLENKVPREFRSALCQLLYRAGLYIQAVQLLGPVVYPRTGLRSDATATEVSIYAVCLIRIGSIGEARALLQRIQGQLPEVDLYMAFAYLSEWNGVEAVPHLRAYLSAATPDPYSRALARVNLIAALISSEGFAEAADLLPELAAETKEHKWILLAKNIYELKGQLALATDDFEAAEKALRTAAEESGRDDNLWNFFVEKWHAILNVRRNADKPALEQLRLVRSKALQIPHPESVRELDAALAQATQDAELLKQVYFGTPHLAYRKSLEKKNSHWIRIPDQHRIGPVGAKVVVELFSGETIRGQTRLRPPGKVPHLGLLALTSDIYRSSFYAQIFARVFTNEYFDPSRAPGRVANMVWRLRSWYEKQDLPVVIHSDGQFYKINVTGQAKVAFLYSRAAPEADEKINFRLRLLKLEQIQNGKEFTAAGAAQVLGISKASAVRLLGVGLQTGRLKKSGASRKVKYKFSA